MGRTTFFNPPITREEVYEVLDMAGIKANLKPNVKTENVWFTTVIDEWDLPALQAAILISGMTRKYHGSNTAADYFDIYRR